MFHKIFNAVGFERLDLAAINIPDHLLIPPEGFGRKLRFFHEFRVGCNPPEERAEKLAAVGKAQFGYQAVDELTLVIGNRNVYRAHTAVIVAMFAKDCQ